MSTKDLILATAKDMISEVGFHKMTTANLARRADISEGTIYRHFESKEDILQHILDIFDQKYQVLAEQCRARMDKDNLSIEDLLGSHFAFLDANAADIKIVLGTYSILELTKLSMGRFIERMRALFEDFLARGMKNGTIRDVPLDHTGMIIANMFFGLMRIKLYWPEIADFSQEAVEFCRRSLVKDTEEKP
ncbi:MAG: TetR/AcrR family transcriptional regulator [Humidesulfovibrio sp.]|uniref:TetR/AcrR family transcriptional regulator n=1 Tax=Humidesulfovibrio sp. TaxID=2910988 RepID=UPI002736D286|nr:TetR/AcrR family transcriptional regulator [Humidesulfovibrio sp.]MDP2849047.1 TetR/AcrR family transcriptional regulator [Humidesulfovibrio sp.]